MNHETVYDPYEELTAFENCAISLPRYAKLIGYDECAFWGVVYEGQSEAACNTLWTEFERMTIAQALAAAQQEIEQAVGYPLCPTWVAGNITQEPDGNDRWVDNQPYRVRQVTRYAHVIEPGVRAATVVASGATVNHATDPAVVGPLATNAVEVREIQVYYPNSKRQIEPSRVTIVDGQVTIEIPRCRMVKDNRFNNLDGGWMYDDESNFLDAVDIKRLYNDPSVNAELVRPGCQNHACQGGCGECIHAACIYIRDSRNGVVDVRPATYSAGHWQSAHPCQPYEIVRLNYRCGLQKLSLQAEMAILRLAHAKSPEAPCSCAKTEHLWRRDRHVPEVLTRERLNCPFGLEQGAWVAWTFAKALKQYRMGVLSQ